MLKLSRRNGQGILLLAGEHQVELEFECSSQIRVGIKAPREIKILRSEIARDLYPTTNKETANVK